MENPLEVAYRDEHFIVVNKPADVKINSDDPHDQTVATKLAVMFPVLVDPNLKHSFRFVHRLDYSTSGCLCVALTKSAAEVASRAFRNHLVQKHYIALVRGRVKEAKMIIEVAIGEDYPGDGAHKMCTDLSPNCFKPRTATTFLTLLETGLYDGRPASKVLLIPKTGRRHQLRVHMCHIGHPIVGDFTYSNGLDKDPHRMMLHASKLFIPTAVDITMDDPFLADDNWSVENTFASLEDAGFLKSGE